MRPACIRSSAGFDVAGSAHAYSAKRIPTSLYFGTIKEALAALDPEEEIVVYCANVPCPASIRAYYLLQHVGYTQVRRYAGGIAEWEDAGYPLDHGPPDPSTAKRPAKSSPHRPPPAGTLQPDHPPHRPIPSHA